MNILVTGCNGQLGNELRRSCAQSENRYLFTDVEQLDITSLEAVRAMVGEENIDVIVNCAAYTNVDKAEVEVEVADLVNHRAVGFLATVAKEFGATLIHISTDYIFDGRSCVPYTEHSAPAPMSVYGRTKLAGEEAILESGCNHIILRTAWLYSAWGRNFVKSMLQLTAQRESLGVVFDQVGTPTFAGDLADAIGWIIERGMTDRVGIYHFTNEGVCSWYDFAVAIAQVAGNDCDIRPIHSNEYPSVAERPHYSVLDKERFRETFDYKIPHWAESLRVCINQLK